MSIYTILPLVSGTSILILGFLVLGKNRKSRINQVFFWAILCVAIWLFATFAMFLSKTDEEVIFWDRIVYIGVIFIPVVFYHFGLLFTDIVRKQRRLLYFGYFISFLFLILSRTNYFVGDLYRYSWGAHTQARFFHHIFLVFFTFYVCLFFFNTYRYHQRVKGIKRTQAAYLLLALFILTLSSLAFLPAYGIDIPPFSYLAALICVLIFALAILKYHLFEIRVILTELLVGVMGVILFLLPFLMPTFSLKILTTGIFLFFCIFGYYLIKATHEESKRREEAERLAGEFERLNRIMNQFLLATQHHLRTPLTSLQGYLSMIYEGSYGEISPLLKSKIQGALESARSLIRLTNEFLDITQFQVGKAQVLKRETDLGKEVLLPLIEQLKPEAERKGLKFISEIERNLPKILLDPEKIKIALFNALDNAIRYTEKGWVKISAKLTEEEKKILIKIADTGIGLTGEEKRYLFQSFFERGERARGMYGPGRGIGLFLSSEIIKSHNGKIWAESKGEEKGSAFFIELPVK